MEDRKIDEMFRSLQEREITPSNNALKNLQDALNEADRNKKKRNPLIFGWIAAAVAVIVVSIGLNVFSTDKSELDSTSIVEAEIKSETEKIETLEEPIVESQVTESKDIVENLDDKKFKASETAMSSIEKPIHNTSAIERIDSKEEQKEKAVAKNEQKTEIPLVEKTDIQIASQQEKRKEDLLKPVDDAELDFLFQQEQVEMAVEKLDDTEIMQLLYEAQVELESQEGSQFTFSDAERLLEQATMEMRADKSLRSILNKAIETGIVEVQALFKN